MSCCRCLPLEPDFHLHLPGAALRPGGLQDGGFFLLPVETAGSGRASVSGVPHPPALCVRCLSHSLCPDGRRYGGLDLAVHAEKRYPHHCVDRQSADALPAGGTGHHPHAGGFALGNRPDRGGPTGERESGYSRLFVFDDWQSKQNFFKQFFSGIFITIVMTELDQDMMQKNLSCREPAGCPEKYVCLWIFVYPREYALSLRWGCCWFWLPRKWV